MNGQPAVTSEPRTWRTRTNPFEDDWGWVVEQVERDPALQVSTLFALLCAQHPGKYRPTQVRTLQRQVATWKATQGPEKEVYFEQVHTPGERAQSDFTHMEDLNVTIAGEPFAHMLYHCVFTYSNVEAVSVCFAETFEALAEGIERALWQFGGVPAQHRTDHLSAAVRRLDKAGREDWTQRYEALMQHYEMTPTTNNIDTVGEPKKWGTSLEKDAFFLTKWGSHLLFFARMRYRWGNISRKTGFANSIF